MTSLVGLILNLLVCTCHASDERNVSGSGAFESSDEALVFNVGRFPQGSSVCAELTISNRTGGDLELKFKPSCGCTDVSPSELKVKQGDQFTLRPKIKFAEIPQSVQSVILCEDKATSKVFKIAIVGDSVSPFTSEPAVLKFDPKSPNANSLKLIKNFPDVSILSLEVLGNDLVSVEYEDTHNLIVHLNSSKTKLDYELLVLRLTTNEGKDVVLTIPIEMVGIVQISPSVVSLKPSAGKYKALVLLRGVEEPLEEDMVEICLLRDGKHDVIVSGIVEKLHKRSAGLYAFSVVFPGDRVRDILKSGVSLSIRASVRKGGWECIAPVVSFSQ